MTDIDRAVEASRARAVDQRHAPAAESSAPLGIDTPLHDAMCDYSDAQAIDAIADVLIPAADDPHAMLAIWQGVRRGIYAREVGVQMCRRIFAEEVGELVIQAAEQYLGERL